MVFSKPNFNFSLITGSPSADEKGLVLFIICIFYITSTGTFLKLMNKHILSVNSMQ